MDDFPQVYPSLIKYRPGRIQSLTPEHEVLLKQCWATLLALWGYDIQLADCDISNSETFVVSDVVEQMTGLKPEESKESKKDSSQTLKRSFFSRKPSPLVKKAPVSSKRMKELQSAAEEKYVRTLDASESTKNVFFNTYKQNYTNYFGSEDDDDQSDTESVDSFVTATSTLADELVDLKSLNIESSRLGSSSETTSLYSSVSAVSARSTAGFRRKFSKYDPAHIHSALFKVVKNDLVDNFVLRYIRARKCKYEDAMAMLTKTLNWRHNECMIEHWLAEGDAPSYVLGKNEGFIKNFTVSKSFVRGQDRNKNPLFVFQSKKHFASDTLPAEIERFALLIIEWCRFYLRDVNESVDTCSLMFDLSGFLMKNADNGPVKFLTSMFESHYPESLGIVIVHNAPWIFSTIWNVIKNWLDPVVASKIHFTKGYTELAEFIEPKHIPEYLGGKNNEDLSYCEPTKEHIKPMKPKDSEYYRLCAARDELYVKFIEATLRWVQCTNPGVSSLYLKEKIHFSYELSYNYISLDPYLRNPGFLDRKGFLELRN